MSTNFNPKNRDPLKSGGFPKKRDAKRNTKRNPQNRDPLRSGGFAKRNETIIQGLTDQEALERLAQDGYNELPSTKQRTFFHILFDVIREPMFLMLITCGLLYLLLGDLEGALMLMGFVVVIIGITFYQEQKTERALEALRDLSSPRALVIRDGKQQRIAGREVVRDDIILIAEGDRVPADAVLLSSTNVNVDESLLTGESVPVRKTAWDGDLEMARPGGDGLPFIFSGTLVVKGQGIAQVRTTGSRTEIGKIGKALQILEPEDTNLQRQVGKIVRNFAIVGVCAGSGGLRSHSRGLAARLFGGAHPGDGHPARRVSGRFNHLPGLGRMADFAAQSADPPRPSGGDVGSSHRLMRG
jgi:magnesium-transporting ATPase (P-type)